MPRPPQVDWMNHISWLCSLEKRWWWWWWCCFKLLGDSEILQSWEPLLENLIQSWRLVFRLFCRNLREVTWKEELGVKEGGGKVAWWEERNNQNLKGLQHWVPNLTLGKGKSVLYVCARQTQSASSQADSALGTMTNDTLCNHDIIPTRWGRYGCPIYQRKRGRSREVTWFA